MNERITLNMSIQAALIAMGGGNPGALTVLMQLYLDGHKYDPDSVFGGMGQILSLDTLGVYEERIWMLYKDVCDSDIGRMIATMRANQLGFVGKHQLDFAIDNYGDGIDVDGLIKSVQERLPNFKLNPEAEPEESP